MSAYNAAGGESFRSTAFVRLNSEEPSDLFFMGFGVSQYRDIMESAQLC